MLSAIVLAKGLLRNVGYKRLSGQIAKRRKHLLAPFCDSTKQRHSCRIGLEQPIVYMEMM